MSAVALLLHLLTLGSLAYMLLTVAAAHRWRGAAQPPTPKLPAEPVSLLRPVRGVDANAYESFATFCRQDHPCYEILFGVLEADDPVLPILERLREEFPQVTIRIVVGSPVLGPNLKVCNLAGLEAEARHPLLVLCDSDMRAEPDFLRRVTAPLRQPEIGLVTCLYKGVEPKTLADRIEALGIGTDFIPSVLVSSLLRPVDFALGSAIALHRDTLRQMGGFKGLAHHLADDYQMGRRVWETGKQVALADLVLEDVLPGEGLKAMLTRRVRWARTVRLSAPAGYRGAFMTHGTTLALLGLLASGGTSLGWRVFGSAWACRVAASLYVSLFALGERGVLASLWLLPVADLVSAAIWVAGLWGKRVAWRGRRYRVSTEGLLTPLDE